MNVQGNGVMTGPNPLVMASSKDACLQPMDEFGLEDVGRWKWITNHWDDMGALLGGIARPNGADPVGTLPLTVRQVHNMHTNATAAGRHPDPLKALEAYFDDHPRTWVEVTNSLECMEFVESDLGRRTLLLARRVLLSIIEPMKPAPWDDPMEQISRVNRLAFGNESWEQRGDWSRTENGGWREPPVVAVQTGKVVGRRHWSPARLIHTLGKTSMKHLEELALTWQRVDVDGNVIREHAPWVDRDLEPRCSSFEETMRGLGHIGPDKMRFYCEPRGPLAGMAAREELRAMAADASSYMGSVEGMLDEAVDCANEAESSVGAADGAPTAVLADATWQIEERAWLANRDTRYMKQNLKRAREMQRKMLRQTEVHLARQPAAEVDATSENTVKTAKGACDEADKRRDEVAEEEVRLQGTVLHPIIRLCLKIADDNKAIAHFNWELCKVIAEVERYDNSLPMLSGAQEVADLTRKEVSVWFLDNLVDDPPGSLQPSRNALVVPQEPIGIRHLRPGTGFKCYRV